jgi:hypothetical protein
LPEPLDLRTRHLQQALLDAIDQESDADILAPALAWLLAHICWSLDLPLDLLFDDAESTLDAIHHGTAS